MTVSVRSALISFSLSLSGLEFSDFTVYSSLSAFPTNRGNVLIPIFRGSSATCTSNLIRYLLYRLQEMFIRCVFNTSHTVFVRELLDPSICCVITFLKRQKRVQHWLQMTSCWPLCLNSDVAGRSRSRTRETFVTICVKQRTSSMSASLSPLKFRSRHWFMHNRIPSVLTKAAQSPSEMRSISGLRGQRSTTSLSCRLSCTTAISSGHVFYFSSHLDISPRLFHAFHSVCL